MTYTATLEPAYKSLTLPAATVRNTEAQNPVTKRNTRNTATDGMSIFCLRVCTWTSGLPRLGANATGQENAKNNTYDTR